MVEAFEIISGVYCVGGSQLSAPEDASVYLLGDADELWLLDSGCGPSLPAILQNVAQLGFDPQNIRKGIATHCHIDHSGGLAELKARVNLEVIAHRGDVDALEGKAPQKVAAEFYGLTYHPVQVDTVLEQPREIFYLGPQKITLQHVPGHTPGSIIAWGDFLQGRLLFGQDLHGPLHPNWGSDEKAWRNSLRQLLALKADILAEGHFGVISPAEEVERFIQGFLFA